MRGQGIGGDLDDKRLAIDRLFLTLEQEMRVSCSSKDDFLIGEE